MIDDWGDRLTDAELLDKVADMGAYVVRRGPVESLDFASWRGRLRREAKARGFGLHVRQNPGGAIVVSNPDHVVNPAQLRAAITSLPTSDESDR